MEFMHISVKLAVGFIGLWVITRLLGKKEISQLTPFDFVSSLMLSEIVGNTIYSEDTNYFHLIYGLAFWMILSYTVEKITYKSKSIRRPLDGEAAVLIENGVLDMKEMDRNNLDFDQLQLLLRQKDIFSIREVAYAVFETNGGLSVLKKSAYQSVSRLDLQLPDKETVIALSLVENGEIQGEALRHIRKDERWLLDELGKQGYDSLKSVAYAEWVNGEKLYVMNKTSKR